MKKTKVRTENSPPKKRVLTELSREEMGSVQGGATKKKAAPKKKAGKGVGIAQACANASDNANLPFDCP